MPTHTSVLYLLCGKIAAGKSTFADTLAQRPATVLISEDHWNATLFPGEIATLEDYRRCSARLRAALETHIIALLQAGLSVVMDFPANTKLQRTWLRGLSEAAGVDHELHYFDVPDDVCIRRLRARNAGGEHAFQTSDADFDLITSHFVAPSPEEGFNVVVHTM